LVYFTCAGFLLLAAVVGANREPKPPSIDAPSAPQPMGQPIQTADTSSPLDEPLRLIGEARQVFQNVKDYSCILIKRERVNGRLEANHVIAMKVSNEPFSVYMKWSEPTDMSGQEVAYVKPKHGTKMRVHPAGALGLVGWVSVDQNDDRAKKSSRHSISEAGLANLIGRYTRGWEKERYMGVTKAELAEYEYNNRRCVRVETTHNADTVGQFEYFRTVLYFDRETKLPIRVECYDYPHNGSDSGELVEEYSYLNVRCNVGIGPETFNH
jgi:hypothetical protein